MRTLTSEQEWDALENEWNALLDGSASRTVFLTWEWLRTWWRRYAGLLAAEGLHLLVAEDESGIAGIAPLYRSRTSAYGLGRLDRLRLIGDGTEDSEYQDLIIRTGHEAEVIRAFLSCLQGQPWDVLELNSLPPGSATAGILPTLAGEYGFRSSREEFACAATVLPATWDEYLRGLDPRFRTKLRSLLRRLPAERGAVFGQCNQPDCLPGELDAMFRMHNERWRQAGGSGSFAQAERRAFYQDVARLFHERGWLRFFSLRIDDRPAAYEFSFEYGGRVYFLQQAYDVTRSQLSVGTALKAYVLKDCVERGVAEYDFLGDAAAYKLKWGVTVRDCVRLTIARPTLKTRWGLAVPRAMQRSRERLRAAAPQPIHRFKDRIRRALRRRRPE